MSMTGAELHVRNLENGSDTTINQSQVSTADSRRFRRVDGSSRTAPSCPGPPVRRPLFLTDIGGGETRLIREDCGARPRSWLDEQTLLAETFGAGLNAFIVVDVRDGTQRPLVSAATRKVSNPRISPRRPLAGVRCDAARRIA